MPKAHSAASELAPLLDGSTAGELIPEIVRHGLQQLIELEVAAVLGAERHERSEEPGPIRSHPEGLGLAGSRHPSRRSSPLMS